MRKYDALYKPGDLVVLTITILPTTPKGTVGMVIKDLGYLGGGRRYDVLCGTKIYLIWDGDFERLSSSSS